MVRPDPYDNRAAQGAAPQPGVQGPGPQIASRVGIKPAAAPTVTAPRSATSAPNAPAGDGQGSDPVKTPTAARNPLDPPGMGGLMGISGQAVETAGHLARIGMKGVANSPLNLHTWPSPGGNAPAKIAPVSLSPADAQNAFFDNQGYGPHSTEAQVDTARGQRNAAQAVGQLATTPGTSQPATGTMAQPQAAWQTTAKAAPAGSPGWRQQFWNYDAKTGQHTFDHAAEAQARQGIGIGVQGATPYAGDPTRDRLAASLQQHLGRPDEYGGKDHFEFTPGVGDDAQPFRVHNTYADRTATLAGALASYDQGRGHFMASDPNAKVGLIDAINASPARRAAFALSNGQHPDVARSMPNPGEANSAQINPEVSAITDGDGTLDDKLYALQQIEGIGDKNHANHQQFQKWFNRTYANPETHTRDFGTFDPAQHNPLVRASMGLFGDGNEVSNRRNELLRGMAIEQPSGRPAQPAIVPKPPAPGGGIGVPKTAEALLAQQIRVSRGQQ
jgi:hypothetical protein